MKNLSTLPKIHFRYTTADQRKMLFKLVKEDGLTVKAACRKCHVGEATYFYWLPRFLSAGNSGVEQFKSTAPKNPGNKKSEFIVNRVLELKTKNPKMGKLSIANEINKEHNWEKIISPYTVMQILRKANLMETVKKKKLVQLVKHAELPQQAVNIDFCFVKSEHLPNQVIPAVSGSCGRLKDPSPPKSEAQWPGQVFNNVESTFAAATDKYVQQKNQPKEDEEPTIYNELQTTAVQKKELNQKQESLRIQRRKIRVQRRFETLDYKENKKNIRVQRQTHKNLSRTDKRADKEEMKKKKQLWKAAKEHQLIIREKRKQEDALWRLDRQKIIQQKIQLPDTKWFAILIMIDNCTRKSISLPLFIDGVHTTAQATAQALQQALPIIEYLISDRGVHFKNQYVAKLAQELGFKQVFVGPHRPQTNGIAERFVRTLKEWLLDKTWTNEQEINLLLQQFKTHYNDRPHQAKELNGLSPLEYERRKLRA